MLEPPPYSLEDEAVQSADDHFDDVSLLDAEDSPGTLDSPPPYAVEDEVVAPPFCSSQMMHEEQDDADGIHSHNVEAVPSVPPLYSHMEQIAQSETENETSMPPGAAPEHTSE